VPRPGDTNMISGIVSFSSLSLIALECFCVLIFGSVEIIALWNCGIRWAELRLVKDTEH
jgi:hypothetical protein